MLTEGPLGALAAAGHARLPGAVDRNTADAMARAVWTHLARSGIDRRDRATWPGGLYGRLQSLRRARVFDAFGEADVVKAAVGELLDVRRPVANTGPWGPALVTFPEPGPWLVPHRMWHFDIPGRGDPDQPYQVRMFGYVTDVAPHGGGTLVVEGSQEIVRRMVATSPNRDAGSSATLKHLLARHTWFAELFAAASADDPARRIERFMVDGAEIDGVQVRLAELTAGAGDVVVMHPWMLHCVSTNTADQPRMMVTHTISR